MTSNFRVEVVRKVYTGTFNTSPQF